MNKKNFSEIMRTIDFTIKYKCKHDSYFKPSIEYIQNLVNVGRKMSYQNNLLVVNNECIEDYKFIKDYLLGLKEKEWFEATKLHRQSHYDDTMYLITYGYNLK